MALECHAEPRVFSLFSLPVVIPSVNKIDSGKRKQVEYMSLINEMKGELGWRLLVLLCRCGITETFIQKI